MGSFFLYKEKKMKTEDKPKKNKPVRPPEDVPMFPYRPVRMETEDGKQDSIEMAQFDFVREAGQPNQPTPQKKKGN